MPRIDRLSAATTPYLEEAHARQQLSAAMLAYAERELLQVEAERRGVPQGQAVSPDLARRLAEARGGVRLRRFYVDDAREQYASSTDEVTGGQETGGLWGPSKGLLRSTGRRKGLTTTVGTKFVQRRQHNSWKVHRRTQYRTTHTCSLLVPVG